MTKSVRLQKKCQKSFLFKKKSRKNLQDEKIVDQKEFRTKKVMVKKTFGSDF